MCDDLNTVAADQTHRQHAIIENVHADQKNSALAHLPSGKFTANAAWLVLAVIAFNLTRVAAATAGPDLAKTSTATIRRKLIHIPARVAYSGRQLTLHLPSAWPWQNAWTRLFNHTCGPAAAGQLPGFSRSTEIDQLSHEIDRLSHDLARDLLAEVSSSGDTRAASVLLHQHRLHSRVVLQSTVMRHALVKPRGYAGDMDLMLMLCDGLSRGDTGFARAVNEVFVPGARRAGGP